MALALALAFVTATVYAQESTPVWTNPVLAGTGLTPAEQAALDQASQMRQSRARVALADVRADMARELMAVGLQDNDPLLQKAALRYAASAADLDPHHPQRWVLLGVLYEAITPLDPFAATEAEVAYMEALAIAPTNPKALLGVITRRWQTGRYSEALEPMETLLKTSNAARAQPVLLAQAGLTYIQSRELNRGIRFLHDLMPQISDPAMAKMVLATLYGEQRDDVSERGVLEEVVASGGVMSVPALDMLEGRR